jgi:hypothetical protein
VSLVLRRSRPSALHRFPQAEEHEDLCEPVLDGINRLLVWQLADATQDRRAAGRCCAVAVSVEAGRVVDRSLSAYRHHITSVGDARARMPDRMVAQQVHTPRAELLQHDVERLRGSHFEAVMARPVLHIQVTLTK